MKKYELVINIVGLIVAFSIVIWALLGLVERSGLW